MNFKTFSQFYLKKNIKKKKKFKKKFKNNKIQIKLKQN